jgi:hypothetical protein
MDKLEPLYNLNLIVKGDKAAFIAWLKHHKNYTITEHLIQRAEDEL